MPRTSRAIVADHCYHVLNRGNNRMRLFHDRSDYIAFLWLLAESFDEFDLPLLAACAMPNHLHLVMHPRQGKDVSKWAHWLFTTHARRYHKKYGSSGRVWQGRFRASIVQTDRYLLTLIRYVERNALTGKLVARAEDWEWGSLSWRHRGSGPVRLAPSPTPLPTDWNSYVNAPQTPAEVAAIRNAIARQSPYGDEKWCRAKATELGLESTLAPRGRPAAAIVTTK
jgi:REP-associated tyrosine transposase